ncbi:hypothetical protein [Janthinobacterium sp. MDT1-19]|uniref:hypothetical protein n=1 Tax=Janthinobacterium sp. MDT1-19 TaxID=1259339 RepID=UPI003F29B1A4
MPRLPAQATRKGKRRTANHTGEIMRINIYSQELTSEVILVEKASNTEVVYHAAQLILHSSEKLHHPPEDDDRSAVTFWLPKSDHRREEMAKAFEEIAAIFRTAPKATGLD